MDKPNKDSSENKPTPKKEESGIKSSIDKMESNIKEGLEQTGAKISATFDKGVKKTKSFFKRLLMAGVLVLILAGIGYTIYANYTYSEGTRAGNLIKISKKGFLFKTYEGQLKLGGIDLENPNDGLSDTWSFSVRDEAVVKQLEQLQGQKVILRYKEINQSMPWQGDSNYFIYAIDK
jgi:hypothetical protein